MSSNVSDEMTPGCSTDYIKWQPCMSQQILCGKSNQEKQRITANNRVRLIGR